MEFLLPGLIVGFLILLAAGFFFGRRDTGKGPHPQESPGHERSSAPGTGHFVNVAFGAPACVPA
jgi:hypothetical protein